MQLIVSFMCQEDICSFKIHVQIKMHSITAHILAQFIFVNEFSFNLH